MKKQWVRLLYVLGLGVLLLLMFKVGEFVEFLFIIIFDLSYSSSSAQIAGIITQTAAFIVVIGVGLKDQRKTLASVCSFKKVSGGVWGAAIICSIGFTLFCLYLNFLFYSFLYGWNTDFGVGGIEGNLLNNLIDNAIIPAVAEEILFKGIVFTIL